jgi:hypothetical protein
MQTRSAARLARLDEEMLMIRETGLWVIRLPPADQFKGSFCGESISWTTRFQQTADARYPKHTCPVYPAEA